MPRRTLMLLTIATVAASVAAFAFGGWASITLDQLPDHYTVGQPTQFSFIVRQHGITPLDQLKPTLDARSTDGASAQTVAQPGKVKGQYVASLTIPRAGDWTVTVKSGFGPSDITLLAMPAVAAGTTVAAVPEYEHGRRLFVAKGCVNCHVHAAVDARPLAGVNTVDLSDKRFDAAYLAMWLANPAIRPPTNGGSAMPNLRLSPREIGALVAFVNSGKVAAAR